MREPIIGPRPRSEKDAAFELDQFPRDPQWVPEWMAVKAAAYHKEAEKWGRRARKKTEKAEAAGGGAAVCDWAHQRYDDCEGEELFPERY